MDITVRIVALPGAAIPEYQTTGSAGSDARAFLEGPVEIHPGDRRLIPTGIHVEIPEGYEIQVRSRSGLALKNGVVVLNSPGTVDSDYRGEIGIVLYNAGKETFTVRHGDRIAQLVLSPVCRAQFFSVNALEETDRGSGGYGSTGKH